MRRVLLWASLLLAALPSAAQSVRLTLVDHVVGTEIVHNAPLPAGTDVWVVAKSDPRSVRLRSGYGEVASGLATARRDRLGPGGQTEGRYQPTARSGRSYFVVARLPDGRLFQSYVKTADAGWQPGFDAVSGGRVSMGLAGGAAAQALRASLPRESPPASPAAAVPAGTAPSAGTPGAAPAAAAPPAAPPAGALAAGAASDTSASAQRAVDSVAAAATRFADSVAGMPASAFDTVATTETVGALDDATLVAASAHRAPVWPWLVGGLLAGALVAGAVAWPLHRREVDRQREHLLRLLPDTDARAAAEAERFAALDAQRAADTARFDRTMQQIDTLRLLLRERDEEIRRLRAAGPPPPPPPPPGPSNPLGPAAPSGPRSEG